jgi:cytochrome o ubiquinol oxidase subunit 1
MLGKLSLDAIPYNEPIIMGTLAVVSVLGIAILAAITRAGQWGYLWREWITSVDHKRIGVMYIILALVMLVRGFADAIMMRVQQAMAANGAAGYLPPHHYDQIFTAHGVIMIFFVATPFIIGLMNVIVPLQIGARDVAFPFLNNLGFWLSAMGAGLVMLSMFVGDFAATGWVAYPPLSELGYSPTVGVDYYIWSLQISGIGTTLTGINFIVDPANAGARHGADENAGLCLDRADHEHSHCRGVSGSDRDAAGSLLRPLPGHALLHQ